MLSGHAGSSSGSPDSDPGSAQRGLVLAAVSVQRARMGSQVWSEAESGFVDKLVAFVRLVRELGTVRDAQQIYEPALSALQAITGVDRSSIMLLDPTGRACFVAWRRISEAYRAAVAG